MPVIVRRPRRRGLRRTVAAVIGLGAVLAFALPASAHVDADPLAVQMGTSATVGFTVEHGCDTSPTTGLKVQFPDGYKDLKPLDKPGWTTAVSGNVVTFSGGPLDAVTKESFKVALTAPATPGLTYLPVIQICEKGELDWITIPENGKPEPEHPASMVEITAGAPTAAELAAPADDPASADATTSAKKASSSHTGLYVGLGIGVVLIAGGAVALSSRRRPGGSTST